MSTSREFDGRVADLYDVFVDWPARLGREMPGIRARLDSIDARRVLDVGCGTGVHARALTEAGYDVVGCDHSDSMLDRARTAGGARFLQWTLGEDPPQGIDGPFDAVVCLGNVWPQLADEDASERALDSLHGLLRPGGLLLMGLKAFAHRVASGNPYLPLLRREHEGSPVFFVRFLDFTSVEEYGTADFHFSILGGSEVLDHRVSTVRVWSAEALHEAVVAAGFHDVAVSGSIDDPSVEVRGEDVFVHARR